MHSRRVRLGLRFATTALACLTLSAQAVAGQTPDGSSAEVPRVIALPPAHIDDSLEIDGEDIRAKKLASRMTVAVEINGTGPYKFVVDSGADTSVVGRKIASTLALPPDGRVMINGMTERKLADRVMVDTLRVGTSTTSGLSLPVLEDADIGSDGILGLDALAEQRLALDFEKRTIGISDARRVVRRLDGEIVVTARLSKGQLLLTSVRAGSARVDAIIDTGSEVTIGNSALREKIARRRRQTFETIEVSGVTGATAILQLVRVPELRIGQIVMYNVPIAFADIPPFTAFGLDQKPALLLGTDLMESFRKVSLDFRARKVRFQLRKCRSDGMQVSTTSAYSSRIAPEANAPAVCSR